MNILHILDIFILFGFYFEFVTSQDCSDGSNTGENKPKDKDKHVDGTSGLTVFMDAQDNEFTFSCCGIIYEWAYYTKTNTGSVYFQVWRQGSSTWNLLGENLHTITTTNAEQTFTPITTDRIIVQSGDILGFKMDEKIFDALEKHFKEEELNIIPEKHFPGAAVISYDNGQRYKTISSYTQGQSSYNWDAEPNAGNEDYGFHAKTNPLTAPTFSNLDATISIVDTTSAASILRILTVSDVDNNDVITTSLVSNESPVMFGFDAVSLEVRTIAALSSGTYKMKFKAADLCSKSSTGTLTIVITNVAPTIHNLPASSEISEDQSTEQTLYVINATDPADTVTCSITNPVTSPFDVKLSPGSTNYAIYVKASQSLDYATQRQYDLTIQCTDGKDPVTGTFTVYILKNAQPWFTNLQNRTEIPANSPSSTSVFTVTSSDPESDAITYSLSCNTGVCPFAISNSGRITTNTDISSYATPGYELYIYASDGYSSIGPMAVSVILQGINSAPIISNLPLPSAIMVDENTALGTDLYTVRVIDINTADTLSFTVTSNPIAGLTYLNINTTSGEVKTSSSNNLNYEDLLPTVGTTFTLTVFVSDGQATVSEDLVITVVDINEAPYFQKNVFGINGDEGTVGNTLSSPGFIVTDPERDSVSYRLDCSHYSGYFTIDSSTAAIIFSQAYGLDIASNPSLITCNVTASDAEFTATATVEVTINDVNDNTPVFSESYYTFSLTPATSVNTVIGTVSASDADAGAYDHWFCGVGCFGMPQNQVKPHCWNYFVQRPSKGQYSYWSYLYICTLYYEVNQTSLSGYYFGLSSAGSLYVRNSLTSFSDGSVLTIVAKVTDGGGLQDKATIYLVMPTVVTVTTVTTSTEKYYTFFDDSRNTAWFTALAVVLLPVCGTAGYLIYTNCSRIMSEEDNIREPDNNQLDRRKKKDKDYSHLSTHL